MVFLFYLLAGISIISALMVVFSKSPMNSVIYLIICFLSIAGHYVLLNAQFLAVVHIIVYTGAIMVLFLFVIMLLNLNKVNEPQKKFVTRLAAVITGAMLFFLLIASLRGALNLQQANQFTGSIGLVKNLGKVLFKEFLLPFEASSVLFLSAMVGAVMLGKRDPKKF